MPRINRRGHRQRGAELSREDTIVALMDSWDYPGIESPLLVTFPEQDRAAMVDEALDRYYAQRARERKAMLRDRLTTWDVSRWHELFSECAELEEELTEQQRRTWDAWRAESPLVKKLTDGNCTGADTITNPAAPSKALRLITTKPAPRREPRS